jgi:hypothetical protein
MTSSWAIGDPPELWVQGATTAREIPIDRGHASRDPHGPTLYRASQSLSQKCALWRASEQVQRLSSLLRLVISDADRRFASMHSSPDKRLSRPSRELIAIHLTWPKLLTEIPSLSRESDGRKLEVRRCLGWSRFTSRTGAGQGRAPRLPQERRSLFARLPHWLRRNKNRAPQKLRHPGANPLALGVRGSIQQRATAEAIPPLAPPID